MELELRLVVLLTVDELREGLDEPLLRLTLDELRVTVEVLLRLVEASLLVQVLLLRLTEADDARELPVLAELRLAVAEVERESALAAEREVEDDAVAERLPPAVADREADDAVCPLTRVLLLAA